VVQKYKVTNLRTMTAINVRWYRERWTGAADATDRADTGQFNSSATASQRLGSWSWFTVASKYRWRWVVFVESR